MGDPNGKRQPWEHIVKIPFVDENLLMEEVDRITQSPDKLLSPREIRRNLVGQRKSFIPHGYSKNIAKNKATNKQTPTKRNNNINAKQRRSKTVTNRKTI